MMRVLRALVTGSVGSEDAEEGMVVVVALEDEGLGEDILGCLSDPDEILAIYKPGRERPFKLSGVLLFAFEGCEARCVIRGSASCRELPSFYIYQNGGLPHNN